MPARVAATGLPPVVQMTIIEYAANNIEFMWQGISSRFSGLLRMVHVKAAAGQAEAGDGEDAHDLWQVPWQSGVGRAS